MRFGNGPWSGLSGPPYPNWFARNPGPQCAGRRLSYLDMGLWLILTVKGLGSVIIRMGIHQLAHARTRDVPLLPSLQASPAGLPVALQAGGTLRPDKRHSVPPNSHGLTVRARSTDHVRLLLPPEPATDLGVGALLQSPLLPLALQPLKLFSDLSWRSPPFHNLWAEVREVS